MKTSRSIIEPLEDRIAPATFTVINISNDVATTGSLPWAIAQANNHAGADKIVFHITGASPSIITLGGVLNITDPLTIAGPSSGKVIISGGGTTQLLNITSATAISGLAFVDGNSNGASGGGIASTASLTVKNCLISGNTTGTSAGRGGGIYVDAPATGSTVSISNSVITGNYAPPVTFPGGSGGGGAFLEAAKAITLSGCAISGNTGDAGGGVHAVVPGSATGITVTGCSFTGNGASGGGGGGLNAGISDATGQGKAKIKVSSSNFSGNTASSAGGGFATYIVGGSVTVQSSTFQNNAGYSAGGVYVLNLSAGTVTISGSKITGNSATGTSSGQGGGIALVQGKLIAASSVIADNTSAGSGGGIEANYNGDMLTLSSCTITGNHAVTTGGGVDISSDSVATITGGSISNNNAGSYGGGLSELGAGALTVSHTAFTGNVSHGNGGGIYVGSSSNDTVTLLSVTISNNANNATSGSKGGGGIDMAGAGAFSLSGHISNNYSFGNAGGIQINGARTGNITAEVTANVATNIGGGIDNLSSGVVTDIPSLVFGNFAPLHPETVGI